MRLSIKLKQIIYSLCIAIVPIALITIVFSQISTRIVENQQFGELRAIAESKRIHVRDLMEAIRTRAIDFSIDGFIRRNLEDIIREGTTHQQDRVTQVNEYISQHKLPLNQHLVAMALIDTSGNVVSSTSEHLIGGNLSDHETCLSMIDKGYGKACFGVIRFCSYLEKTCLLISASITSTHDDKPIGALVNYYDMAVLEKITANRIGMGKTGEVYLVDIDKKMLTVSRFIGESPLRQTVDTLPVNKILEGKEEMTGVYPDYRGIPVAGSSLFLPEYGWILLTEIDKAEVYAPIKKLRISAIILGVIAVAIAIAIGIVSAFSISKPVMQLKNTIEKFKGDGLLLRRSHW